jgi:hypothetical protein
MVAEIKSDAPELALDAQTQSGFVKWFNSLPKVGGLLWGGGWVGARRAARSSPQRRRRRGLSLMSACR